MERVKKQWIDSNPAPKDTWYDSYINTNKLKAASSKGKEKVGISVLDLNWRTPASTLRLIDHVSKFTLGSSDHQVFQSPNDESMSKPEQKELRKKTEVVYLKPISDPMKVFSDDESKQLQVETSVHTLKDSKQ